MRAMLLSTIVVLAVMAAIIAPWLSAMAHVTSTLP